MEPYYPCTWLSFLNQKNENTKKLKFVNENYYCSWDIIFQNNPSVYYTYSLYMQTTKTSST